MFQSHDIHLERLETRFNYLQIQRPALYETKTLHSIEMYSTWFGDDVIRFMGGVGLGWGEIGVATSMQF